MPGPCSDSFTERLKTIEDLTGQGLDAERTRTILALMEINPPDAATLAGMKLYSEYLPKAEEKPFTDEQRYLQFLWDSLEHAPLAPATNFAFSLRRIIAKRLFLQCGRNFCAEAIRFNFGQNISAGNDVFINAGTYIDAKGGVTLGDAVGIGEWVRIFTHTHSESDHAERTYAPVVICDYTKVYSGAMILPGVTIGEQAIVAGGAVVTKDVPPNAVAAGIPAQVTRQRRNEGRSKEQLNHIWLYNGAFQDE